jgi:FMN phosphatase YigB (HAD superfamily)
VGIRAVFFDLDNTLLRNDGDAFLEDFMNRFGRQASATVGGPWTPLPEARHVVSAVRAMGCATVLATAPVYLEEPIRERMRRAGVDDIAWDLLTTSDRMHAMKPRPEYFAEAAALIGVPASSCLMVGDDPFQDLAAARAGLRTYYVGPLHEGLDTGPGGSLLALLDWLQERLEAPTLGSGGNVS